VRSWAVMNTVFTLRYADLHFRSQRGGIEFGGQQGQDRPGYRDFAYVAFTIGMTYQGSDTTLRDPQIRRSVLAHAILSYLFGVVIVAGVGHPHPPPVPPLRPDPGGPPPPREPNLRDHGGVRLFGNHPPRATPGATTCTPRWQHRGTSGGARRATGTGWRSVTGSGCRSWGRKTLASTTSRRSCRRRMSTPSSHLTPRTSAGGPTSGSTAASS